LKCERGEKCLSIIFFKAKDAVFWFKNFHLFQLIFEKCCAEVKKFIQSFIENNHFCTQWVRNNWNKANFQEFYDNKKLDDDEEINIKNENLIMINGRMSSQQDVMISAGKFNSHKPPQRNSDNSILK
jgi:predicted membrane protein